MRGEQCSHQQIGRTQITPYQDKSQTGFHVMRVLTEVKHEKMMIRKVCFMRGAHLQSN